jgi:hypothetical protein
VRFSPLLFSALELKKSTFVNAVARSPGNREKGESAKTPVFEHLSSRYHELMYSLGRGFFQEKSWAAAGFGL